MDALTSKRQLFCALMLCGLLGCREGCGQLRFESRDGQSPAESSSLPVKPTIVDGEDWSLPDWVKPTASAGLVGDMAEPDQNIAVRVFDVTWRQLNPQEGVFSQTQTGNAGGISMASFQSQLGQGGPFWMRIWASGVDWAPQWVINKCSVSAIATDYNGEDHLPLWNPCVWGELLKLYRQVFIQWDLRSNPDLRFVEVPGGFAWCEFDFEVVGQAAQDHGLTLGVFKSWFQQAMTDLVSILNGENQDTGDDFGNKLVFTGRDYPGTLWGVGDDLFASSAVAMGLGIRIPDLELFNYHNNQLPSLGAAIDPDGHVVMDESAAIRQGGRLTVAEGSCFNDCGHSTSDPQYAVRMAILKALQLRVQYLYVLTQQSYLQTYPALWDYARLALGKTRADSPDAWVALREAQDKSLELVSPVDWTARPWVRNLERFLFQRDVAPDGLSRRGSESRTNVLDPTNGASHEGRQTDRANGSYLLYFEIDDGFLYASNVPLELAVSYLDRGYGPWWLEYAGVGGRKKTEPVTRGNTGLLRTASFLIEDGEFDNSLPGGTDFSLVNSGEEDLEVRFVRAVKQTAP